jgi:hypothetical protein
MHATENLIICEENLSTNKHPWFKKNVWHILNDAKSNVC